jgi:hypothetical protein
MYDVWICNFLHYDKERNKQTFVSFEKLKPIWSDKNWNLYNTQDFDNVIIIPHLPPPSSYVEVDNVIIIPHLLPPSGGFSSYN